MTKLHWNICERSTRWAAALRVCWIQRSGEPGHPISLHEVRSLSELPSQLETYPHSLVLLEITPENLEAALTWLAASAGQQKHAKAVALLDYRRTDNPVRPSLQKDGHDCPSYGHEITAAALREAGAVDVIDSPRQIRPVLELGECHASSCKFAGSRNSDTEKSFEDWAWSLLPWQDAVRPVR